MLFLDISSVCFCKLILTANCLNLTSQKFVFRHENNLKTFLSLNKCPRKKEENPRTIENLGISAKGYVVCRGDAAELSTEEALLTDNNC